MQKVLQRYEASNNQRNFKKAIRYFIKKLEKVPKEREDNLIKALYSFDYEQKTKLKKEPTMLGRYLWVDKTEGNVEAEELAEPDRADGQHEYPNISSLLEKMLNRVSTVYP